MKYNFIKHAELLWIVCYPYPYENCKVIVWNDSSASVENMYQAKQEIEDTHPNMKLFVLKTDGYHHINRNALAIQFNDDADEAEFILKESL